MISMLRVDERLLHGQIAISWCKALYVDTIIIANEQVLSDEFTIISLKLSKPRDVNIVIQDTDDCIKSIKDGSYKDKKVLLVVRTLKDAAKICNSLQQIKFINIGNITSRNPVKVPNKFISLSQEDLNLITELKSSVKCYIQRLPEDKKEYIGD